MSKHIRELTQALTENAVSSRRGFLGRAGNAALVLAAGAAGALALSGHARGDPGPPTPGKCCCYNNGVILAKATCDQCPARPPGAPAWVRLTACVSPVGGRCLCPVSPPVPPPSS
jgi:hypothetical protein